MSYQLLARSRLHICIVVYDSLKQREQIIIDKNLPLCLRALEGDKREEMARGDKTVSDMVTANKQTNVFPLFHDAKDFVEKTA